MAVGWNARIATIQAAGVPCEIAWDGGTLYNNAWGIPKGAPNRAPFSLLTAYALLLIERVPQADLNPERVVETGRRLERVIH